MKKKIIVIGSGIGGLSAAIRLAALGHEVEIFEKRDKPGGRAYVFEKDGYKFDAGPTVITAPFMLDDLWSMGGKRREDYFQLVKCDPYYRIFDHTGRYFDYNGDEESVLRQIAAINPGDAANYPKYLEKSKAIFQKGFVELADHPFLRFSDMLKVTPDLLKVKAYLSVYQYVSQFFQDEFLRRCFSFHPLLIGGNPFAASSIYALVDYLEQEWGIHYVMGGTGAMIAAMAKYFQELGGKLHLNSEVTQITVKDRQVTGVLTRNSRQHPADIVVSNADSAFTYHQLLPSLRKKYTDRRLASMDYSVSLVVIYFGTDCRYEDERLAHHNIILGERYKTLLHELFRKKDLPPDFSLYLHYPSKTDPSVAPAGGSSFYVLSPVPHLGSKTDWQQTAKPYRDAIMQFLEDNYLPDLQKHIVMEHMVDPRYFKNELNSYLGAGFSIEPTLLQSAWFRPHNQSEEFSNLYFVGAGTHPGAGIPGVLSSAIIAQKLIGAA
jgi:phytoene desaturase